MKFFLIKDGDDTFAIIYCSGEKELLGGYGQSGQYRSTTRSVDILPISWDPLEVDKCALLRKFLETELSKSDCMKDAFWSCKLEVGLSTVGSSGFQDRRPCSLEIFKRISPEKDCVGLLATSFPGNQVQVDWKMIDFDGIVGTISTGEMNLAPLQKLWSSGQNGPEGPPFSEEHFAKWKNPSKVMLNRMTITVTIPDDIFFGRCGSIYDEPLSRRILDEELFSDVTIVCCGRTKIKAHRSFLAASSSVFTEMFESDRKDSRESVVEMYDMEGKSVRALLKLLYHNDAGDAEEEENFLVAYDLFQAAQKYEMKCVEGKMRTVILNKPNKWFFDLDVAVELFFQAHDMTPTDEELKMKMAKVLKSYSATLEHYPVIQQLFRSNYKAALELLKCVSMDN